MHENPAGAKLKTLRKMTGVSQKALAVWLGCAPSSIPNYESGFSPLPFRMIRQFANAGIPFDYFTDNVISLNYQDISLLRRDILDL